MTSKKQFLKSGAMLASVALLMRGVSLAFNAYITDTVGAEGDELRGKALKVCNANGKAVSKIQIFIEKEG